MFAPAELKNGAGDSSRGGYAGKTRQDNEALLESLEFGLIQKIHHI